MVIRVQNIQKLDPRASVPPPITEVAVRLRGSTNAVFSPQGIDKVSCCLSDSSCITFPSKSCLGVIADQMQRHTEFSTQNPCNTQHQVVVNPKQSFMMMLVLIQAQLVTSCRFAGNYSQQVTSFLSSLSNSKAFDLQVIVVSFLLHLGVPFFPRPAQFSGLKGSAVCEAA